MGQAEYSYYFILEKYLPLLTKMGEIHYVSDPAMEVDELYSLARASGQKAVFLSFTPPHRVAKNLTCPTICVLAWEYDSIPDETWDPAEPWHNWVEAIRAIGAVATISDYATDVIRGQVGLDIKVETIPAPVTPGLGRWQRFMNRVASFTSHARPMTAIKAPISLSAYLIDSHSMDIDENKATYKVLGDGAQQALRDWDGSLVEWDFSSNSDEDGQQLVGFYDQERWGVWSRTDRPMLLLPWKIDGVVELTFDVVPYEFNEGEVLSIDIGGAIAEVQLKAGMNSYTLTLSVAECVSSIIFSGIKAIAVPGARDHRTLGIGLCHFSMRRLDATTAPNWQVTNDVIDNPTTQLTLSGTVYTALLNPADGRKNWEDILTAFCCTFRDQPDKTLILKMSHRSRSVFQGKLLLLFSRLSPFKCRVVAVHGFLSTEQLNALIDSTDFFVNASTAEGQCLPLLEFMARGVPAIAPDHTAMKTYINRENAFVVQSSEQPSMWPQDPRRANRTVCYRTDWESLARAYYESDQLIRNSPGRYADMCAAAIGAVNRHYSARKIARNLREFLFEVAR